jgi:predicted DNA-binding transcriptional regulator AlpA
LSGRERLPEKQTRRDLALLGYLEQLFEMGDQANTQPHVALRLKDDNRSFRIGAQCRRSAVGVSHILGVGRREVAPLRGRHRAIRRSVQGLASVDVALEELAGLAEIAEILRVSRSTAARYAERADFPAPIGRLGRGRIWRRRDVEKWGRLRLPLPKPGRPKKTPKHG